LLLILNTYAFALVFTDGLKTSTAKARTLPVDQQNILWNQFGGIKKSTVSLLETVLGGADWADFATALSRLHPVYEYVFLAYVIFAHLAMLNVVTGIFVDSALRSARHDKQMMIEEDMARLKEIQAQLEELFHEFDSTGEGHVNVQDLQRCLADERVRTFLGAIGINFAGPADIIEACGAEPDDDVNATDFVEACLEQRQAELKLLHSIHHSVKEIRQQLHQNKDAHRCAPVPAVSQLSTSLSACASLPLWSSNLPAGTCQGKANPYLDYQQFVELDDADDMKDCVTMPHHAQGSVLLSRRKCRHAV